MDQSSTRAYARCTLPKPATLARDRTLEKAAHEALLSTLDDFDHQHVVTEGTHTFLKLIPELRNAIYRELLVLRRKQERLYCYPSILSTCKQIRDEATSILYGDNPIEVTVSMRTNAFYLYGNEVESVMYRGIAWPLDAWPQHLLHFHQMTLTILAGNYHHQPPPFYRGSCPMPRFPTGLLRSLSRFLSPGCDLRRMNVTWYGVELEALEGDYQGFTAEYLQAICRICPEDGLSLSGLSGASEATIRTRHQEDEPLHATTDPVKHLLQLALKASHFEEALKNIIEGSSQIRERLKRVHEHTWRVATAEPFATAAVDRQLAESVKVLQRCVEIVDTPALNNLLHVSDNDLWMPSKRLLGTILSEGAEYQ